MTLIAALEANSCQFLLGDLLISEHRIGAAPLSPFKPIFLPSVGLTTPPDPNASNQIANLRQKLVPITRNLAIGWSGSYSIAQRLVTAMFGHFSDGPTTLDNVQIFIETCDYDDLYRSGLSLVGICHNDNVSTNLFGLNTPNVRLPFFEAGFVGGSGFNEFVDLCMKAASHSDKFSSSNDVPPTLALAKVLFITAMLSAIEIYNQDTLRKAFGGFFESMFLTKNGFYRCGNILYSYLQFFPDEHNFNKGHLRPVLLVKIDYAGDVLLIRRIHFEYDSGIPMWGHDTVAIGPIYRNVSMDELEDQWSLDMNAAHYCHTIFVTQEGPWPFIIIPELSPPTPSIRVIQDSTGMQLALEQEFLVRVIQQVASMRRG